MCEITDWDNVKLTSLLSTSGVFLASRGFLPCAMSLLMTCGIYSVILGRFQSCGVRPVLSGFSPFHVPSFVCEIRICQIVSFSGVCLLVDWLCAIPMQEKDERVILFIAISSYCLFSFCSPFALRYRFVLLSRHFATSGDEYHAPHQDSILLSIAFLICLWPCNAALSFRTSFPSVESLDGISLEPISPRAVTHSRLV